MSPAQLYIAKSGAKHAPALPLDAVTRTFGIFGQRGTGKTTAARVLVEEMAKRGGHVIVFDPVGVWWGATRAGEGPGIPGIVLGGEHGDVPLEETAGQLVADLAVGRHWRLMVVDLKLLRKGAQLRFMADCLEALFHANREPLHVVFEEADRSLPQTPRGMDPTLGRVLGAAEDIVKLGRSRGLAATLVSQRFATVAKNVVEQADVLLLLRMLGPNDRKAVKTWIESNGDPAATEKVLGSMASLAQGEGWLYSPGWLRLLERIRIREPKTFDSSATPEVGQQRAAPAKRAPVDLDALREQMAETVERAKANDPKELRARIAELEQQLAEQPAAEPERVLVPDREAVAELSGASAAVQAALVDFAAASAAAWAEQREREERFARRVAEHQARWEELLAPLFDVARDRAAGRTNAASRPSAPVGPVRTGEEFGADAVREQLPRARLAGADGLSAGAASLVDGLSRFFPLWLDRGQLALLLGRGKRSSTLTQQLAEAVQAGALEADRGRYRVLPPSRPDGKVASPTVGELRERFRLALPDGPRALFEALIRADGADVPRDELFRQAGFSPTSSTPVTHLKLLTDNGLATRGGGIVALGPAVR